MQSERYEVTEMDKKINVPLSKEDAANLRTGDYVYLTGTVYTARDAAHKRMAEALEKGEALPFDVNGNVIYYMGPSPAREGRPIGSAGPTTAGRMDPYAPKLLDLGLRGMIGKGRRTKEVVDAVGLQHLDVGLRVEALRTFDEQGLHRPDDPGPHHDGRRELLRLDVDVLAAFHQPHHRRVGRGGDPRLVGEQDDGPVLVEIIATERESRTDLSL